MVPFQNGYFLSVNTVLYRKQICVNIFPLTSLLYQEVVHVGEGFYRNFFFLLKIWLVCSTASRFLSWVLYFWRAQFCTRLFNWSCIIVCTGFVTNCFLARLQNAFWELQAEIHHCYHRCYRKHYKLWKLCNILHLIFYNFFII